MRGPWVIIGLALAVLWCSAQDNSYQRGLEDARKAHKSPAPAFYNASRQLALLYGDTLEVTVVSSPRGQVRVFVCEPDSLRELTAREMFDLEPVVPR